MTAMRICMLNDNYYRGGGVTIAIKRIIQSPPLRELEIYLAGCSTINGHICTQEDTSFVSLGRYHCFRLMKADPTLFQELYRFAAWLREMKFDILHVHHRRLAVLANLLSPLSGVPVLFTCHSTFQDSAWFRELAPKRVTGVSPSVVDYLRRATRAPEVRLISNPLEFDNLERPPGVSCPVRAISIGRLDRGKGFDQLLEAWLILKSRGLKAQVDIFGEGPLRAELQAQIEGYGLMDAVRLCGYVPNILEHIAMYSFNILVSEKEGLPNAVVEAAAQRIPTLLSDVDGSRDVLPPALALPNGIRFGNVNDLVDALTTWLDAPLLIHADGQRFYEFLKPRCSPDVIGTQYLAAYAACLAEKMVVAAACE